MQGFQPLIFAGWQRDAHWKRPIEQTAIAEITICNINTMFFKYNHETSVAILSNKSNFWFTMQLRGMQSAPLWSNLGGALGVTFVLGSIVAIPEVGVVVVICVAILGEMIGSYLSESSCVRFETDSET